MFYWWKIAPLMPICSARCFSAQVKKGDLIHVERLSQAIDACNQQTFNVVLLDLNLPDSERLDTVAKFRAAVPDIPVVILTMMDDEELALQAMTRGAQDYLVKDQIRFTYYCEVSATLLSEGKSSSS